MINLCTQKIVIKVQLKSEKCRTKALKIAANAKGVSSVSIKVETEQVEVIGDGVDVVKLARSLMKKLSFATIVSVAEVITTGEETPANPIQWASNNIHHPQFPMHYDDRYYGRRF
ncbi:hypothetical protein FF1_005696 [Malus domestica]